MIPSQPPRRPQLGFLVVPPYRIQGLSIAGEETAVQIPELDVCFDIGVCYRAALASKYIALTHGHMDHAAGLAYYFSQRQFQGMGVGTVVCHQRIAEAIHNVMKAWVALDSQVTPYNVVPLVADQELEIKPQTFLRAFETVHTVPSLGYCIIERRSKLREDLAGVPQEKLIELKKAGEQITREIEVPHVCCLGDTMWGEHFDRPDVRSARILITECTFLEPGHRDRAVVGRHLHVDDIARLLEISEAEAVVLTHLSRRSHIGQARECLRQAIPAKHLDRVHILMDSRANRSRYEQQLAEAEADAEQPNPEAVDAEEE